MSRQRFVVEIDETEQFSEAAIASFMRRSVDNPAAVRATEVKDPVVRRFYVEVPGGADRVSVYPDTDGLPSVTCHSDSGSSWGGWGVEVPRHADELRQVFLVAIRSSMRWTEEDVLGQLHYCATDTVWVERVDNPRRRQPGSET